MVTYCSGDGEGGWKEKYRVSFLYTMASLACGDGAQLSGRGPFSWGEPLGSVNGCGVMKLVDIQTIVWVGVLYHLLVWCGYTCLGGAFLCISTSVHLGALAFVCRGTEVTKCLGESAECVHKQQEGFDAFQDI